MRCREHAASFVDWRTLLDGHESSGTRVCALRGDQCVIHSLLVEIKHTVPLSHFRQCVPRRRRLSSTTAAAAAAAAAVNFFLLLCQRTKRFRRRRQFVCGLIRRFYYEIRSRSDIYRLILFVCVCTCVCVCVCVCLSVCNVLTFESLD